MNAEQFYQAIKAQLDRLTSYSIPLHIRVENQNGSFDSVVDVKEVELYDTVGLGLQITLRKIEEPELREADKLAEDYSILHARQYIHNDGSGFTSSVEEVKKGFLAGYAEGKPKWHKVADGDLPQHEINVLVLYNNQYDIAHYNYDYKEWHFADSIVDDVIAWCEIPKYEEVK